MTNFISMADFHREVAAKRKPTGGVFRLSTDPSVAVEGVSRTRRFCFSDGTVDRMGDTIAPDGWEMADFLANPVALWAHDSSSPPIGRASNVVVEGDKLMGDIEFAPPETYDFADTIYRLLTGGFLNAVSVGFLPIDFVWVDTDPGRQSGIDYRRQSLLEISVCPIPANPNALGAARAKGIDTRPLVNWAEKLLDSAGGSISKPQLLSLRSQAREPRIGNRPRHRTDDTNAEGDPSLGGVMVGNCGRPADKECGMQDPAECAIHGMGEVGLGDHEGSAGDKTVRSMIKMAIRTELRRLRGGGSKRLRRRSAEDDSPGATDELPEGHEESLRTAAMHFKSAEDYYDAGDEHHDEGMDLMDEASKDLDADDGPPPDHADTVRTASVRFKSADALYDLGDEHHDKAIDALDKCVKALDGEDDAPPSGTQEKPEDVARIAAALARVKAARSAP